MTRVGPANLARINKATKGLLGQPENLISVFYPSPLSAGGRFSRAFCFRVFFFRVPVGARFSDVSLYAVLASRPFLPKVVA